MSRSPSQIQAAETGFKGTAMQNRNRKHKASHRRLRATAEERTRQSESVAPFAHLPSMLPPFSPFCPISAAKIAGLKATVTLLLVLLIKSKLLRVKMSLLGSFLGLIMLTGFLLSTGVLTLVAGGAVAYAASRSKA